MIGVRRAFVQPELLLAIKGLRFKATNLIETVSGCYGRRLSNCRNSGTYLSSTLGVRGNHPLQMLVRHLDGIV